MSDPTQLCAGGQFQPPSPSGVRLDRSQGLRICFASDSRLPRSGQFPASSSKSSCRSPPTPLRIAILKQFLWLSCHIEVFPNRQHSCRCFLQITWLLTAADNFSKRVMAAARPIELSERLRIRRTGRATAPLIGLGLSIRRRVESAWAHGPTPVRHVSKTYGVPLAVLFASDGAQNGGCSAQEGACAGPDLRNSRKDRQSERLPPPIRFVPPESAGYRPLPLTGHRWH